MWGSEQDARTSAEEKSTAARDARLQATLEGNRNVYVEDGVEQELQTLNIILKGDASGSVEALRTCLEALPQGKVQLRFLLAGAGELAQSDPVSYTHLTLPTTPYV